MAFSYHDLYVTAPGIPRTRLFDLPYCYEVTCTRTTGWRLYKCPDEGPGKYQELVGGEYGGPNSWLVLDVDGYEICNSRDRDYGNNPDDDEVE